jgi:hypothetical protein
MGKHEIAPRWILVVGAALLLTAACHEIVDNTPPDYQTLKEARPVGNAKQLDVRLQYDVGALEVRAGKGDDLFSLNLDYDANRSKPRFDFSESGDRATLRLTMDDHHLGFNSSKRANDLTLTLNDKVPLDLDLTAGVSDSHLDMTDLDIKRFHLRGGVGKTEVTFDHPTETSMSSFEVESGVGNLVIRGLGNARAEQLKVSGGVGRTDLDFTGDLKDTQISSEISVGVGQVRLVLPREVGVRIEADGSFLSNISAPGFDKEGNTYTHRGSENSTKIVIRVRSGVGGVTVELI